MAYNDVAHQCQFTMTHKLSTEDIQTINQGLADYIYINEEGRLDLESFCVTLASCMYYDEPSFRDTATATNFHMLLLRLIQERAPVGMFERWVQPQTLIDWTPEKANLYPNRERTCIHMAALISYSTDWIALMGSHVLDIPDEEWRPEYFGWAKESWHFTHTFLSGYHHALFSFAKRYDLKSAESGELSGFETLQLAQREDISFDDAGGKLTLRNKAWSAATTRISTSIENGYFLEAITLSENFISNMLFNFLSSKQSISNDLNFHSLIQKTKAELSDPDELKLIEEVDTWRRSRNDAIHNFISSSIDDFASNSDTLSMSSKITALNGQRLTNDMLSWYREKAVNFINHHFQRTKLDS